MKASVFSEIYKSLCNGQPYVLSIKADGKVYCRRFLPDERLVVLGGGNVSQAVSRIAATLEFRIIIADDRPAFANSERFPDANEIICDEFSSALDRIGIRSTDYVCVMTRGHRHDALCVRHIMSNTMPLYLGMMGSERRVADFRDVLKKEGFSEERIAALHAPIGIDINAKTPSQIAVSVAAQLVAERRKPGPANMNYMELKNADYHVVQALADTTVPKAIAMVLRSIGSVPAKCGAIMSVDSLGLTVGTVGGGCSEARIITKARKLIGTGENAIVEVNMTNEVAEENGMVCGGRMWVYIEDVSGE